MHTRRASSFILHPSVFLQRVAYCAAAMAASALDAAVEAEESRVVRGAAVRPWVRAKTTRPASFAARVDPSSEKRPDAVPAEAGRLPSWQQAGTLFRWSFSDETGGPNLDEPLVTDRPDFTEASSTVGRGVAQVEFGYTFAYDSANHVSTRTQSWGEPLLRYGFLADWLEFRAALFPLSQRIVSEGRRRETSDVADLYFGLKLGLTPQAGVAPEMALVPQITIPTGSSAPKTGEVLPGLNWLYSWELTERLSLGGSSQFNRALDEGSGRAHLLLAQSITSGYRFTNRLGLYAEWFALVPHSAETARPQHYFDFGFTYLLSDDIQWDIRYGKGLNRAAADFFVGTGLSIRFK